MIWVPFNRRVIMAWCIEPLSIQNIIYRVDVLCKAFGLPWHYMAEYCLNRESMVSMGPYLTDEIIWFIIEHPDVSLNQPTEDETFFATLDVDAD